jgi:formate hydrogenlyase subunit 4
MHHLHGPDRGGRGSVAAVIRTSISVLLFLVLAPLAGGLLAGLDRKLTARMQARVGPPLLQPFFDVMKLWHKENVVVRRSQNFYIEFFFLFVVFTGALFFAGYDLLLVIFSFTLASIFLVLGAYKASSPFSAIGATREMIQLTASEPMVLLAAVGLYLVTGSFYVKDIIGHAIPPLCLLPGVFVGFLCVLPIKFRKSPFDLSTSHHAHQEIVKGITTEFSGRTLALIEVAHWYETALILGFVALFAGRLWWLTAILVPAVFFAQILADNTTARVKWQAALETVWSIALVLGIGNIIVLSLFR